MTATFKWLMSSPSGRASACDRCNKRVKRDEPRLRAHDKLGPNRVRGKGARSSYMCVDCAWKYYGRKPPAKQKGLFDG
jgi:hypothetical protein